ncbi:recombinase family protein [Ralstonia syzygii]|uniref:DNA-invertase from lambdoid prophag n=1 Tax=Ralstonia syzygii R24 TaxID=907261 RepID=G3A0F8_9RALS|nr:recombinase family protein [Ralstonia syzygii]CCA84657.1 DNA-invertase from lambdoid prophag [Ralstonia syzygii R24]
MLYGYARVSTQEQETHAQTDALAKAGVGFVFAEKRSGSSMSQRPQLEALLQQLSPGDTVVVYKLDRIARSLKDLLTIIERIEEKGAQFRSLTESLDTSTPAGRMIFHIVGAFAEFERELIRERTRVGMAAAVKRGVKLGRHYAMSREDEAEALRMWYSGQWTKTAIARRFNTHISSVKRAIKRHQASLQPSLLDAA